MEITKREILASVSIIALMLLIGVSLSNKISEFQLDRNEEYNKAIKIKSSALFRYGMKTNVGNAFVYGDLKAVDTVTYKKLGGAYMSIKRVTEEYTKHTEIVYEHDDKGNITGSHEETYWTWDEVGSEIKECKRISFCGVSFDRAKIVIPGRTYITTQEESSRVRYKYYGTATKHTGTIYSNLKNNTILDRTSFYENKTIEETIDCLESNFLLIIFWVVWIVLTAGCVFGFYYIDNEWLE